MRAGRLRGRVRIEIRAEDANDAGIVSGAWRPLCGPYRCQLIPLRGTEDARAGLAEGRVTWMIKLRGSAAVRQITDACRVVDDRDPDNADGQDLGRIWNIKAILNPDQRGREYQLTCEEEREIG